MISLPPVPLNDPLYVRMPVPLPLIVSVPAPRAMSLLSKPPCKPVIVWLNPPRSNVPDPGMIVIALPVESALATPARSVPLVIVVAPI